MKEGEKVGGNIIIKSGLWYTISNFLSKGILFLATPLFPRTFALSVAGAVYVSLQNLVGAQPFVVCRRNCVVGGSCCKNWVPLIVEEEECQDIDTPSDWALAEYKYRILNKNL